jgi:hypothetical protein
MNYNNRSDENVNNHAKIATFGEMGTAIFGSNMQSNKSNLQEKVYLNNTSINMNNNNYPQMSNNNYPQMNNNNYPQNSYEHYSYQTPIYS